MPIPKNTQIQILFGSIPQKNEHFYLILLLIFLKKKFYSDTKKVDCPFGGNPLFLYPLSSTHVHGCLFISAKSPILQIQRLPQVLESELYRLLFYPAILFQSVNPLIFFLISDQLLLPIPMYKSSPHYFFDF